MDIAPLINGVSEGLYGAQRVGVISYRFVKMFSLTMTWSSKRYERLICVQRQANAQTYLPRNLLCVMVVSVLSLRWGHD